MYFREHKGSYEESMKTIRKIESVNDLGDVVVSEYGYDNRLNCDTKIVLRDNVVIGFITEKQG